MRRLQQDIQHDCIHHTGSTGSTGSTGRSRDSHKVVLAGNLEREDTYALCDCCRGVWEFKAVA
jgi:hypothetical protein